MSESSASTVSDSINVLRQNYDISNPVVADIIRAKEQRLKILQELIEQQQAELHPLENEINSISDKVITKSRSRSRKNKQNVNVPQIPLRKSLRIQNSPKIEFKEPESNHKLYNNSYVPKIYGSIPGVEVGRHWDTRIQCSYDGIHRPTVAGIHGGPDGAYSIAISGGYPEDVDNGLTFLYTGAGGRELKGTKSKPKNLRIAPQTKDQELEGANLALLKSIENQMPVRVIRGYKNSSIYAPESGYRYDGLYRVVDYIEDVGKTGFRVYRFKFERIEDQAPPPWETQSGKTQLNKKNDSGDCRINLRSKNLERKENIDPLELNSQKNKVLTEDLKDFDKEIHSCIDFLLRLNPNEKCVLKSSNAEEQFNGWDSP